MEARVPSRCRLPKISAPGKSPALAGRPPRTCPLGRTGFSSPRGFEPESPSPEPDTVFPPPRHAPLSPGALELQERAASCSTLRGGTPCRASFQGRGGGSQENERRGMAWPWNPFQCHNLFATPCAKVGAKQGTERTPLDTALPLVCRAPYSTPPPEIPPSPKGRERGLSSHRRWHPRPPAAASESPSTSGGHRAPAAPRRARPRAPTLQRSSRPVWMHSARDTCSRSASGSSR